MGLPAFSSGWREVLARFEPALAEAIIERIGTAWSWYEPAPSLVAIARLELDPTADRHWEDLALLDGVRRAIPEANEVFDRAVIMRVRRALRQWGAGDAAEDLLHERLARLLGPVERIGWLGRGRLLHWLRVALRGDLIRHLGARRREHDADPVISVLAGELGVSASALDLELDVNLLRHGAAVREAMGEGFAALTARQKAVMRYVLLEGLTANQVAAIYGVHRVTVQSWLKDARESILSAARSTLRDRFGLREVTDLLAQLARRVDLSLSRHLGAEPDPPGPT